MEYDRHILNSNNVMKTSWKLINKELSKNCNNYWFQSVNINGRRVTNLQSTASAFNKHFTTFYTIISQKINASNCSISTSDNNWNNVLFFEQYVLKLIRQY
jgi:hypothetical protein